MMIGRAVHDRVYRFVHANADHCVRADKPATSDDIKFPPVRLGRCPRRPPPHIFQSSLERVNRGGTRIIIIIMLGHLVIAVCCITAVMPVPAKLYDQRQTGDLNVQIELKDLQVVALLDSELLEDYADYDYFYDYADFTIKPSNRPTTSTTSKTTEKNDIAEVTEPSIVPPSFISALIDILNSTERNANVTSLNDKEAPNADPSNSTANSTSNAGNDSDESQSSEEDGESGTVVIVSSTTAKPVHALRSQKRCKSGYIPNGDGRCRRASRPHLSLLPL